MELWSTECWTTINIPEWASILKQEQTITKWEIWVLNTLTKHFTKCWGHEKSNSSKMSCYNNNKNKFAREVYLDVMKGFSRRYSTSKLRKGSHDLAIERGRYSNTSRELRTCHWCKYCMEAEILEDENHVMHECDLYSDIRAKLI